MSRIFAAVAVASVLLAGSTAISVAYAGSDTQSDQLDGLMQLWASGIDVSALVPVLLLVGLGVATLGVMSR